MKIFLSIYFGFLISYFSYTQHYPHDHMQYDFIDEKHNELVIFNKKKWSSFLSKIHNQWHYGGEEINIIQFGGSHIQADVWSNRLRDHFQHIVPYNGAARGLYFPFKLIKSNASPYLKTTHNGEWKGFRNSVSYHHSPFGLLGARAELIDSTSLITFYVNKEHCVNCYFDQIDFLVHDSLNNHCIDILTDSIVSIELDTNRQSFILSNLVDSVAVLIERESHEKGKFSLFGLNFTSQLKGITYHSVGVNGASVPSYLRCEYFMGQIDLVNPDLIIFSIGINDAYEPSFLSETYFKNYDTLINLIKEQYPDANFLFTTNNDSYYKRKVVNERVVEAKKTMYKLAKKHDGVIWDLFSIMGGMNSIVKWEENGLAKSDKIHFTTKGYKLTGDLFFEAFLKSYKEFLEKNGRI